MSDESPNTTQTSEKNPSTSSTKNIIINGVLVLLGLIVLYFLVSLTVRIFNPPPDPSELTGGKVNNKLIIQVEVLNGNGVPKITDQMITYLRSQGFDVVEKGNYNSFNVENSAVIDRIGNHTAALKLAQVLNIDESKIQTMVSYEYYADLTLVLGKDFKNLTPFNK